MFRFQFAPVHLLRPSAIRQARTLFRRPLSFANFGKSARNAFPRLKAFGRPYSQTNAGAKPEKGIKALVKEYGYSALGVYLFISMLDLPICYLLVHSLGKEQIEVYENKAKQFFGYGKTDEELHSMQEINRIEEKAHALGEAVASPEKEESPFAWFSWTEFVLAYGIHKSVFIFVRVPLTAAFTPAIVKTLRRWGFKIGTDKLSTSAALAKDTISSAKDSLATAANPKFGTRPTRKNKWFWFF